VYEQARTVMLAALRPADGVDDVLADGLRWWGELDQRVWHQVGEAGDNLIDGLGDRAGEFVSGLGNLFGNQDLVRQGDDFAEHLLATGADNRSSIKRRGHRGRRPPGVHVRRCSSWRRVRRGQPDRPGRGDVHAHPRSHRETAPRTPRRRPDPPGLLCRLTAGVSAVDTPVAGFAA
jgi:hypothetical protein